ncbi:hypothetical protein [Anaerobacterium chartisolvens]|nr:hypothetical protein [Anaerobacterium chartisolvens]
MSVVLLISSSFTSFADTEQISQLPTEEAFQEEILEMDEFENASVDYSAMLAAGDSIDGNASDVTYYVDGENGNDANTGLTGYPTKTIQACINKLKKINAGRRKIYIEENTYTENININNFHGGEIYIQGNNVSVNGKINIYDNTANIEVLRISLNDTGNQFDIYDNGNVSLYNCYKRLPDLSSYTSSVNVSKTSLRLVNCVFQYQYIAIYANNGAMVTLQNVDGLSNNIALYSVRSIIFKDSASEITGTTPQTKSAGGQIFS